MFPSFPPFPSDTPVNTSTNTIDRIRACTQSVLKMRFSTTALLALPLLASAAESPFEQYKAKFQNFLGSLGASPPAAGKADAPAAAAVPSAATGKAAKAKAVEPKPVATLSLNTWKDTFYAPVQPAATTPEEWLVLVTGGNKTCFGAFLFTLLST